MRLLYGFSNCSYKKYDELMAGAPVMVLQQAQKYHSLLMHGLVENDCEVLALSGLPINRQLTDKIYTKGGDDTENGIKYHYFGSFNVPGLRQVTLIIKTFLKTLFTPRPHVAICDILNISILIGMLGACRLRHIPIIGIVTDVPGKLASPKQTLANRVDAWLMRKMDAYVLLTKYMNDLVNPKLKPWIVIEGQVDSTMAHVDNNLTDKERPNVIMYAGSMQKIYGLPKLVEAFININPSNWELHIYGDGDYREELEAIAESHPNVKYNGIRSNTDIVEAEIHASLLVNPRPTDEEFTKYSFPSKNMEYMVSGTPILTTKLPGMPDEYLPYIYLLDDESIDGLTRTLCEIFASDSTTLHDKGASAKKFVLSKKNEMVQASQVVTLAKTIA